MAATESIDAMLLRELKRHAPHHLAVYQSDSDDEPRKVAIPSRRRKWDAVIRTITAVTWSRVECLDKTGAVLGYIENDSAPEGLEDLGDGLPKSATVREATQVTNLVLTSVRTLMREVQAGHAEELRTIMTTQNQLVQSVGTAMQSLAAIYGEQAAAARAMADERAATRVAALEAAQQEKPDEMRQLLDALPALLQVAGMARSLLGGGGSAGAGSASSGPLNGKQG